MKRLTALLLVLVLVLTAVPAVGADSVPMPATVSPYNLQIGTTQTVKVASIGDYYELSNGVQLPFTLSYGGTTYLPLRKVAELLSVNVAFDGATKTVKIGGPYAFNMSLPVAGSTYTDSLAMNVSPFNITVNGETVAVPGDTFAAGATEVPFCVVYKDTTYLPLRKLGELLGVTVGYDAATKTVQIKKALTAAELQKAQEIEKQKQEQAALAGERALADKITTMKTRNVSRNSTDNGYDIVFAAATSDKTTAKVTANVDVVITNDDGDTLYEKTHTVKPEDYIRRGGDYVALIKIYDKDMEPGANDKGTISFKVVIPKTYSYWYWDPFYYTVYDLPVKLPVTVTMRTPLPKVLAEYDYSGRTEALFTVTDFTYTVKGPYSGEYSIYLYFTGEKTFDENGAGQSSSCKIGWKLYDSDGYTIDSGTCYSADIKEGEKFKNAYTIASDIPAGDYYLEILSTN